jgi:hypothetical protein
MNKAVILNQRDEGARNSGSEVFGWETIFVRLMDRGKRLSRSNVIGNEGELSLNKENIGKAVDV